MRSRVRPHIPVFLALLALLSTGRVGSADEDADHLKARVNAFRPLVDEAPWTVRIDPLPASVVREQAQRAPKSKRKSYGKGFIAGYTLSAEIPGEEASVEGLAMRFDTPKNAAAFVELEREIFRGERSTKDVKITTRTFTPKAGVNGTIPGFFLNRVMDFGGGLTLELRAHFIHREHYVAALIVTDAPQVTLASQHDAIARVDSLLVDPTKVRKRSAPDTAAGKENDVRRAIRDLAHTEASKRADAAILLGERFPEGAMAVPLLEVCLRDEDKRVREAAAQAISALATAAAPVLAEFLSDTAHQQNVAFRKALALLRELGAHITPFDLDKVEGRAARAARLCLAPPERDATLARHVRPLTREILASDAGLFAPDHTVDEQSKIACAALALFGLDALPQRPALPEPGGLMKLLAHGDPDVRWAGVQLARIVGSESSKVRDAVQKATGAGGPPTLRLRKGLTELIESLPSANDDPDDYNPYSLPVTIEDLAALGKKAGPALPRLRQLYVITRKHEGHVASGLDLSIGGAICQIAGPSKEYLDPLIEALADASADRYSKEGARGANAAWWLININWDAVPEATRRRAGKAASAALETDATGLQGCILALLVALGDAAKPAASRVGTVLGEADVRYHELVDEVRKEGRFVEGPGAVNAIFVARTLAFISEVAIRHRAIHVLANCAPHHAATRALLVGYTEGNDPLLACEAAAALRLVGNANER